jgi:hypothetical protein
VEQLQLPLRWAGPWSYRRRVGEHGSGRWVSCAYSLTLFGFSNTTCAAHQLAHTTHASTRTRTCKPSYCRINTVDPHPTLPSSPPHHTQLLQWPNSPTRSDVRCGRVQGHQHVWPACAAVGRRRRRRTRPCGGVAGSGLVRQRLHDLGRRQSNRNDTLDRRQRHAVGRLAGRTWVAAQRD